MNSQLLFLIALCGAEFLHNILEIWGIRQKVNWLDKAQLGQAYRQWPMNINTKTKTFFFHLLVLVLFSGLFFVILRAVALSDRNLVVMGILLLLINYANTTWQVDSFHTHIGKLITRAKQYK